MPVTLRKRPAPAEPPAAAPPAKKKSGVAKTVAKVKETVKKAVEPKATKASKTEAAPPAPKANGSKAKAKAEAPAEAPIEAPEPVPEPVPAPAKVTTTTATKVEVGETIDLEGFGGEIETNDGEKTTLKKLVDASKNGVVLFTYPKASTSGCTIQVCAFRDSHASLSPTGYSIYGLSKDSPTANTTFKTKQKLPYTLLCDTSTSLISAIGLKKGNSTTRGVFIIDKSGKVLAAQPGTPKGTLEVVEKLIGVPEEKEEEKEVEAEAAPEVIEGETEKETEKEVAPEKATEEAKPKEEEKKTEESVAPETNGIKGTNSSASKEDIAKANVAADVADTAEKLDSNDSETKAADAPTTETST
ncbi:hypothetical protein EAF04_005599 [Stromatinia cepivora]|nr:hypothetical protein EAF04_005599 [Stromatinia cepivora]